jgi:hypothetical protein
MRSRGRLLGMVVALVLVFSAVFVIAAIGGSHDSGYVPCITHGLTSGAHPRECLEDSDDTTISSMSSGTVTTASPTQRPVAMTSNCGTDYLASGWPTTTLPSPAEIQCITTAFATGRRATYVEIAQTDGRGGHPLVTTISVEAKHKVLVTTNPVASLHGGRIRRETCTDLLAEVIGVTASRCRQAPRS